MIMMAVGSNDVKIEASTGDSGGPVSRRETRLDKVERVLRGRGVKLPLALTS